MTHECKDSVNKHKSPPLMMTNKKHLKPRWAKISSHLTEWYTMNQWRTYLQLNVQVQATRSSTGLETNGIRQKVILWLINMVCYPAVIIHTSWFQSQFHSNNCYILQYNTNVPRALKQKIYRFSLVLPDVAKFPNLVI